MNIICVVYRRQL